MTHAEFKLEKRAVNNKDLFTAIHNFVSDGILNAEIIWSNDDYRETFVVLIEAVMEDIESKGLINQWNVICDFRNNNIADMDKGIYVCEITYRQKDCLNTTRLIYTIKDLLISNIKELIDFDLSIP